MSDHILHNRRFWDADADAYQEAHGAALAAAPVAWGAFRIPESQLRVLGDLSDLDVLELGCGAAQWSIALADQGVRVVGLDLSTVQLAHARRASARVALVHANGEQLPFPDARFDVVFGDHGAVSFCDPAVIIPEAARVLRPGGRFVFCATHPLLYLTWNEREQRQTRRFQIDYEELGRIESIDGTVDWALTPGAWVRVLRGSGFEIEDLIELQPEKGVATTYEEFVPPKWAQRWPAEWIWVTRLR